MSYNKFLSFVGCLMGMPACSENLRNKTFELPLQGDKTHIHQLTGGRDREKDSQIVEFNELLRFKKIGQTVDAYTYWTLTQGSTGEAFGGQFAVQATLRKGYTGGPPGFATELFIETGPLRFVRSLPPPPAPPGARGIVPGQVVVRMIPQGELDKVDDRYLIDLPAISPVQVWMVPNQWEHGFDVSLAREGSFMPTRIDEGIYIFETNGGGIYELRIVGKAGPKVPDRYSFALAWGHVVDSGWLAARKVQWLNSEGK
jgi:hypothetical protein